MNTETGGIKMEDFNAMFVRSVDIIANNFHGEDKVKLAREIRKRMARERRYQMREGYKSKVMARNARKIHSKLIREGIDSYRQDPFAHTAKVASMLALAFNLMVESSSARKNAEVK